MRASFAPSVVLFSSFSLAAFATLASLGLVGCGGETASLGSQGAEQGTGGAAGGAAGGASAGAAGAGTAGTSSAGAPGGNCATIAPVCNGGEYLAMDPVTGCAVCRECPDLECGECPVLTPPSPDFCKGGKIVAQKGADGCQLPPACVCDETAGDPGCPGGQKPVFDTNGGCTYTCPPVGCIEIVAPGPEQCPSGGFVPKYAPDGCLESYSCLSCPVVGDPSFCANGTVVVGVKDGKCNYGAISCVPCPAAEPPFPNWCNDGTKVVKQDGKCLGAATCSCPDFAACPAGSVSVKVPDSACGAFACNDAGCSKVEEVTGLSCDGNFTWERDAKGCISGLVCNAPK